MLLATCPSCQRHVEISETECPFCEAKLSNLEARLAPRTSARLTRAAMFAFAAGIVVAGCSSDDDGDGKGGSAGQGGTAGANAGGAAGQGAMAGMAGVAGVSGIGGVGGAYGGPPGFGGSGADDGG